MATQIDDKYKSPYGDHEWQEGYGIWESGFKKGTQCIMRLSALLGDALNM